MIIGNKLFGMNKFVIGKNIAVIGLFFSLSGCGIYGSSFGCGDATGAKCMPMDRVDRLIASGEIERFSKISKCSGFRCKKMSVTKEYELPALRDELVDVNIEFNESNENSESDKNK